MPPPATLRTLLWPIQDDEEEATAAAPAAATPQIVASHVVPVVTNVIAQGQQLLAVCVPPFGFGQGDSRPLGESDIRARDMAQRALDIAAAKAAREDREPSRGEPIVLGLPHDPSKSIFRIATSCDPFPKHWGSMCSIVFAVPIAEQPGY